MLFGKLYSATGPHLQRSGTFREDNAKIGPILISLLGLLLLGCSFPLLTLAEGDQIRYQRFLAEQNRYGKPRPRPADKAAGYAAEHMIRNNLWFVDELKTPPYRGTSDPQRYQQFLETTQTVNRMVPIPKIRQTQAEINAARKAAEMSRTQNRFSLTPQDIQGYRQARRNYLKNR